MTEWNGIKTGGLYKKTGRGSKGAPLLMVVKIEQIYRATTEVIRPDGSRLESARTHVDVTMMVNGRLVVFDVRHFARVNETLWEVEESLRWLGEGASEWCGADRRRAWERGGKKWPYKAVE